MNESINKELIFNYFSGRATAFEKELIDQWSVDTKAKEQLFVWLLEWENQNLQYQANVEKGLSRHFSSFNEEIENIEFIENDRVAVWNVRVFSSQRMLWLTAAAVLLFAISGGLFFQEHIRYKIYATNFSEIQRLELTDGTRVVLNSNSTLLIPRFSFGKATRNVYMTGEASFAVTHTKDHKKFTVHTDKNLDIEVLGTEFNVYARQRGSWVVLNKGKVKLHYLNGTSRKQIMMKPGDLVTMNVHGQPKIEQTANPQNYSAWKIHRFVFENKSLREICNLLEDNFGLMVTIPDSSLASQTISGSFTALNAEELLEILTDDSGLSYKKSEDGKVIILNY